MRIAAANKFIGKTIQGESERQLVEKRYSPFVSKPPLANTGRLPLTDHATRSERDRSTPNRAAFSVVGIRDWPPTGQSLLQYAFRDALVMRHVIEQTKTGSDFVHEIEDGQGRRALVKAITVTAHIEAEQAADQKSVGSLVRDDDDGPVPMLLDDSSHDGQSSVEDVDAGLSTDGSDGERVLFPDPILFLERRLDLRSGESFPVSVIDLAKRWLRYRLHAMGCRQNSRGLHRALQGAGVESVHALAFKPFGQARDLPSTFIRQRNLDRSRETVFCCKRGRSVAHEKDSGWHGLRIDYLELFEPTRVFDTPCRRSSTHAAIGSSPSPEAVASETKCLVQGQAKFVDALRFLKDADVSAVSREQQNDAIAGAMMAGEFLTVCHAEVGDQKVHAP